MLGYLGVLYSMVELVAIMSTALQRRDDYLLDNFHEV